MIETDRRNGKPVFHLHANGQTIEWIGIVELMELNRSIELAIYGSGSKRPHRRHLSQGYQPVGNVDQSNPPQGGSGVMPR